MYIIRGLHSKILKNCWWITSFVNHSVCFVRLFFVCFALALALALIWVFILYFNIWRLFWSFRPKSAVVQNLLFDGLATQGTPYWIGFSFFLTSREKKKEWRIENSVTIAIQRIHWMFWLKYKQGLPHCNCEWIPC